MTPAVISEALAALPAKRARRLKFLTSWLLTSCGCSVLGAIFSSGCSEVVAIVFISYPHAVPEDKLLLPFDDTVGELQRHHKYPPDAGPTQFVQYRIRL